MARKFKNMEASDWFAQNARSAVDYRRNLMANQSRYRTNIAIGKMYVYYYDPKHKDTLPIYDRFPLVFPIERYDNGFLGLNLHYLSVPERRALLKQLMAFASNTKLTPNTRLQLSYNTLKSIAKIDALASRCIKRYLTNHIRSRFVEITSDEWLKALDLPVANFVRKK